MAYQFVNNFSQTLAAPLGEAGTTLELNDGGAMLAGATSESPFPLTLILETGGNESHWEVVYVTDANINTLTVIRGQEGTTSPSGGWEAGSKIACRLTAATAMGEGSGSRSVVIGDGAELRGEQTTSIAIGKNAKAGVLGGVEWDAVVIGSDSEAQKKHSVVIGSGSVATEGFSVAIGRGVQSYNFQSVAIGDEAELHGSRSVAIGFQARTYDTSAVAIGNQARPDGQDAIGIGRAVTGEGDYAVSLGLYAQCSHSDSVAIGPEARSRIPGGMRVAALPYLPTSFEQTSRWWGGSGDGVTVASRRCSASVVVSTGTINMKNAGPSEEVQMPGGAVMFIEKIDVVVMASSAAAGDGVLKIGSTAEGQEILPPSTITATSVRDRTQFSTGGIGGKSGFFVHVESPDSGTSLNVRVVIHGYVME